MTGSTLMSLRCYTTCDNVYTSLVWMPTRFRYMIWCWRSLFTVIGLGGQLSLAKLTMTSKWRGKMPHDMMSKEGQNRIRNVNSGGCPIIKLRLWLWDLMLWTNVDVPQTNSCYLALVARVCVASSHSLVLGAVSATITTHNPTLSRQWYLCLHSCQVYKYHIFVTVVRPSPAINLIDHVSRCVSIWVAEQLPLKRQYLLLTGGNCRLLKQSSCANIVINSDRAHIVLFPLLTADSGSAALYSRQETELFIMNCDIDGAYCMIQFLSEVCIVNYQETIWCNCMPRALVCISGDMENQVEREERTRLINQVLELQHTLEGNTHSYHSHTQLHFYSPGWELALVVS